MYAYLKNNSHFILILFIWIVAGMVIKESAMLLVPASVILFKIKGRYTEMLIGFIFILTMSDSRESEMAFAKTVKDIYLLLMTAFLLFDRKQFTAKNTFINPYLPFILFAAILIAFSPITMVASQKTLSWGLLFFTIPAYFLKCMDTEGAEFFRKYFYLIFFLLLAGFVLMIPFPNAFFVAGRYNGVLGNPNGIGIFCTLNFLLFYAINSMYPQIFGKQEKSFIYGLLIASILFAVSRNSMVSILLFLLFARFHKLSPFAGFSIFLVVVIAYQIINNNLIEILQGLGLGEYLRSDNIQNGSGRIVAWTFAWEVIQSQFLIGKGFSFDEHIFHINFQKLSALGHQGGVHNVYLAMWLNTGLIGLILFLTGFFATIYKATQSTYLAMPAMYAIMFSITFEAWLMGSLNPYTILYIILMNLFIYKIPNLEREKKDIVSIL